MRRRLGGAAVSLVGAFLLVPTIWITRDQMLLSMDLALELLFRL